MLVVLFEYFVDCMGNEKVCVLVEMFDVVIGMFFEEDCLLGCVFGMIDNCGSYFYFGLYWV